MTDFTTKLDSSSNRQLKQYRDTTMQLSGSTQFGIPDYLIPVSTATTINIDALQYIQSRGYILATDPIIIYTGVTTVLTRGSDGIIVNTPTTGFTGGGVSGTTDNDWVSGGTFNTGSGDLTLTRVSGGTVVTNLDGRYVTGSTSPFELIDEGSGDGIIISGRVAANYGPVGFDAFDITRNYVASSTHGATGSFSLAFGDSSIASGYGAMAFGFSNNCSQTYSTAFGYDHTVNAYAGFAANIQNTVTGIYGNAFGSNTVTSGGYASGFGVGSLAKSTSAFVVGQSNVDYSFTAGINKPDNPMFVVGNGSILVGTPNSADTRSDAFTVYYDGLAIAPSLTTTLIDNEVTGRVIVTREWVEGEFTNAQKNINGNYTILSGDNNTLLVLSATSAFNITTNSGLTDNFQVEFINIGTSTVTFLTSGTANLNFPDGTIFLPNKVSMLIKIGSTNNYWLKGELE